MALRRSLNEATFIDQATSRSPDHRTAAVHAAAWKPLFDDYLRRHGEERT